MRWQNNREPRIVDDRLATFGPAFEPVRVVAPNLFTARVMARIEVQPTAVPVRVEQRLREGLLVVAATLVFSLLILLASVSVLAIFAPTTALMLFGAVVSGLVSLFSVSGDVVAWAASTTASEVMLASLAFIASVSLLIRAGIIRDSRHAPREA